MFVPFLNYLTSSYRSLSIDRINQTLLFRSSFARAYRFSDIVDFNLEVVNEGDSILAASNKTGQDYILSLHFANKAKEELLNITIYDDESEQIVFRLKDYFEVLLMIQSGSRR
jgi:hypothetical protein